MVNIAHDVIPGRKQGLSTVVLEAAAECLDEAVLAIGAKNPISHFMAS